MVYVVELYGMGLGLDIQIEIHKIKNRQEKLF